MRNKIGIILLAVIITTGLFYCKKKDTTVNPPANQVYIQNIMYNPLTLTVKAGTTVTWTNKDNTQHTVTNNSGSTEIFDSGTLNPGQTFTHTFANAGSFAYHCNFHSTMAGTVVAQ